MYKVLWIDDEHEDLEELIDDASLNKINLSPYASLASGMAELEQNYRAYEAVLLDAKFFAKDDDKVNTEDTGNAIEARDRINQLADKKKFEIFMLSGQHKKDPEALDGSFQKMFKKIYRKGNPEDLDELWSELKRACEEQPDVQLRRKYAGAFAVCKSRYYLGKSDDILVKLTNKNETGTLNEDDLNAMRKVLEELFPSLRKHKLIPDGLTSLNAAVQFLRGQPVYSTQVGGKIQIKRDEFPREIAQLLSGLVEVTQQGSHLLGLDNYLRRTQSNLIIKGCFFQLVGLLEWFKDYFDQNPQTLAYDYK